MRRRLAILSLATTTLVVIAFLVPLGLLVKRQAEDRARLGAESTAQSTASLLPLVLTSGADPGEITSALGPMDPGTVVFVSTGSVFGEPLDDQGSLIEEALAESAPVARVVDGGWEFALPVVGREVSAVVDVFVTNQQLTQGVDEAWLLLGLLGVFLIGVAVFVADRLGQTLVRPIVDLASAARRLGGGDLDVRVDIEEPEEIREVGESFNWLAGRLEELLAQEREAAADLSHRLRTPLTSLRLQAEKVSGHEERQEVLAQVDRLEEAIDQLIVSARSERSIAKASCDLSSVVAARCAFWSVLADEQGRTMELELEGGPLSVGLTSEAVGAMVDALIGNVFSHTPTGTDFGVATGSDRGVAWLEVSDEGSGFGGVGLAKRGVSGGGSTGLGLDIVRKTAESTGGSMEMNNRPGRGAVVRVWLGGSD